MTTLQQEHGNVWERYIRRECRFLLAGEVADVDKNWEAPNIPGTHRPREKSKPDFSGFLYDGRHVVFEAKATLSRTSFAFSAISDHQRRCLERAHEWGAVAFVYVLDGSKRKWVLPWAEILRVEDVVRRSSFRFTPDSVFRKRVGETWLDTLTRIDLSEIGLSGAREEL